MKKITLLIFTVITMVVYGNNEDSLRMDMNQYPLDSIKNALSILQQQCLKSEKILLIIEQQQSDIESLRDSNHFQQRMIDDYRLVIDDLGDTMQKKDSAMSVVTQQMSHQIQKKDKQIGKIVISGLVVILYIIIFTFLTRRTIKKKEKNIQLLCTKQEQMQISQEMLQEDYTKAIQSITQFIEYQISNNLPQQTDHGLALKVADELVRIEANLSHMDSSVKGYKQLLKAVDRIKSNFLANGYEIVDMLDKPYHDGMKVVANFITDETLAKNEQRITGIIKPQINFNGTMIQSAQITVSQNL